MTRTVTHAEFVPALRELQEQGRPVYQVAVTDGGYRIEYGEPKQEQPTLELE